MLIMDTAISTFTIAVANLINGLLNTWSQRENRIYQNNHHAENLEQRERIQSSTLEAQSRQARQSHDWRLGELNWPLTLSPEQFACKTTHHDKQPLVVLLSPPANSDPSFREAVKTIENELRTLLQKNFDVNDSSRPVDFLGGAWKIGVQGGESTARAIFHELKHIPTLIIDLEIINRDVLVHTHFWGINSSGTHLGGISLSEYPLPLGDIIAEVIRRRMAEWGLIKEIIGRSATDDERDKKNWDIYQAELNVHLQEHHIDKKFYTNLYDYNSNDLNEAVRQLTPALQLLIACVADIYHLYHYNAVPILDSLLEKFIGEVKHDNVISLMKKITENYHSFLYKNEPIQVTLSDEEVKKVKEFQQRLENAKGKVFTFLLIGKAGAGKSSTINSLMEADVAPVHHFDPCTMDVSIHEKNINGAIIRVIDTPGLCDQEENVGNDQNYIQLIRQKIPYSIDAILYTSRLDDPRVDGSEKRGLRLITEAFGELFWKKAIIVFTRSENVKSRVNEYLQQRTIRIHNALLVLKLSNHIVSAIPSLAVENEEPKRGFEELLFALLNRVDENKKDVLILSTTSILEKKGISPLDVFGIAGVASGGAYAGGIAAAALGVGSTSVGAVMGPGGAVLTGLFAFSNPIGWAIILGGAIISGGLVYKHIKK